MIKKLLVTGAVTAVLTLTLVGCGQTGPLYLPDNKPDNKTSTK